MKASDYIVEFLISKGVKTVFGYMGGMVTHIADSIHRYEGINFVQTYHEQSAAFAAVGYARYTNNIGIAIATSGPGATNLMTGIGDAFFDSVPTIFITGQVNTSEYKYDKPVRQLGFQETNIIEIVKPITKYAKLVDKINDIPYELEKAFQIATGGRKGPVLLDIPLNIQREFISFPIAAYSDLSQSKHIDYDLENVAGLIRKAKRPVILIGGGVASAAAHTEMRDFIKSSKMPFLSSLMGKSVCDEFDPLYIGTIGSYGNRCANMAISNADLLLVFGSRLDVRQTGGILASFVLNGTIVHIDIDETELDHGRITDKIKIHADVKQLLPMLTAFDFDLKLNEWYDYLAGLKANYSQVLENQKNKKSLAPYNLMELLNKHAKDTDIFCADVGLNQMWAMQMLKLGPRQHFYTSGGFGAMGSGLPITVGIAFAKNNAVTAYSINGDGGLHMSSQSLLLISQYDLPIKVIIINNKALGMITQFQALYFNNVMVGTDATGGYAVPDFEGFAKAYHLKYFKVDANDNKPLNEAEFSEFFACKNCILEYIIDDGCRVYPKLEYNQPIYNPSPILSDAELEANMLVKYKK